MPKLNIKLPNGHSQEIEINSLTEGSVLDLKKHMASAIDIPAEYQRVVYKGRILKDADPLTSVGLLDGVALHVVRSAGAPAPAAASTSAPAPAPAPTPAPSQQENNNDNNNNNAAANPFASLFGGAQQQNQQQQAPQQQNPFGGMGGGMGGMGGLAGMMGGMGGQGGAGGMDPNRLAAAAQMMQSNPQMQAMMQQMMQNPQMMRTVLQMDPNINAMPEPQRSQTLDLLTNPLMLQGMMNMMGGQGGAGGMGGGMGGAGGANPFAQMMGGGAGGQGGGAAPPANLPQQPQMSNDEARTRYASQLQQLQSMGFPNEDANIRALIMSQGNVDFAVARLLGD